jgi:hypothetical protein
MGDLNMSDLNQKNRSKGKPQRKMVKDLNAEGLAAFEQEMRETAQRFLALRDRYMAVREAQRERQEVLVQLSTQALPQADLNQLQSRLETLEVTLESQLPSWEILREPFWQAIRFGGLGLVLGWVLHAWVT